MNADQEFEKYAKEHGIEPSDEYGSTYQLAKYWFMLVQRKPLLYVLESKEDSGSSSWEGKVDTQSGAFTQDEIDNATAWR